MQTDNRTLSIGQKAGWGLADMGVVVFVIVKQLLVLSFLTICKIIAKCIKISIIRVSKLSFSFKSL